TQRIRPSWAIAESVEELARNLWMVLLAGHQAEEQMWSSLAQSDADLCEAVKRCSLDEMKPLVSEKELSVLRQRYWGDGH
ncbi:MAG: hypothetical protein ABI614_20245, partial [Planctomycetota bacterium]